MGFKSKPYTATSVEVRIEGSTLERGKRFIHEFMEAMKEDSTFKIGFAVAMASEERGKEPDRLEGIVVIQINDSFHAFTPPEARKMADSMEKAISNIPFETPEENGVMHEAIMALRQASDHVENTDLATLAKTSGASFN